MADELMAWDCEYCETTGMWGNEWECRGCSRPRSKRVSFYRKPGAPKVTPAIRKQMGAGNPNWYCNFCESGNKDRDTNCQNCGAERGSAPTHQVKDYGNRRGPFSTREAEEMDDDGKTWNDNEPIPQSTSRVVASYVGDANTSIPRSPAIQRSRSYRSEPVISQSGPSFDLKKTGIFAGIGVAVLLLVFLIYNVFFNLETYNAYVHSYSWSQSVSVQEFQVVHDSNWGSHPSDAYNVHHEWKDTGENKKVIDGYHMEPYQTTCQVEKPDTCFRDNGDGTGTEYACSKTVSEPCTKEKKVEDFHYEDVYDDYYTYDVNRWQTIATHPTSGNDHEPYFATNFTLPNPYTGSGNPQIGQTQSFQNLGTYTVTFCVNDEPQIEKEGCFSQSYSLPEWQRFQEDVGYEIEVNVFNSVISYPVP